jgi:hypothetical protein
MRSLLEKAVVHILNGDQEKAETLFHKFMVERARTIHESLRQGNDVQLNEGWESEIQEEEYFDDLDTEEGEGTDVEGGGEFGSEAPVGEPMGGEPGMEVPGEPEADEAIDDLDAEGDLENLDTGEVDIETKLDDIEAKMDELSAQFDQLMASVDGGEGDDMAMGDEEMGDIPVDDEGGDDMDMSAEPAETDDLADRMEHDLGDEEHHHEPEEEMTEDASEDFSGGGDEEGDDEMMEDITESVLAELDRVAAVSNTEGKEIGSGGKTVSGNKTGALPHHGVQDRVSQGKPVMVKAQGDAHNDSFERETAPTNKTVDKRRNNDAGVKKLKPVPAKGDASANLNTDFAGGIKPTNPIIDGKKGIK